MTAPDEALWTYDRFEPGADLARFALTLDERRIALWNEIYGTLAPVAPGDAAVPSGLLVAAMMESYVQAIQPRPPGNIHTGQTLNFSGLPVAPGAALSLVFSCIDKTIRRDRYWVTFGARVFAGERPVLTGEITTIWAA